MVSLPCPTPENCSYGEAFGCKPYGRLNVRIDGQDDDLGSFIFRTTGYNSIRTLAARLKYYQALVGEALPCLPLGLKLRAKSTTQSHRTAVYFVDLVVREGLTLDAALQTARQEAEQRKAGGWDQAALDEAAADGLALGAFEDSEEEGDAVVEEFFQATNTAGNSSTTPGGVTPVTPVTQENDRGSSLAEKLKAKAERVVTS
ncbi:Putative hydrolase or metal-binding protein (fragment) [Thiomonas sp. X19]